MAMMVMTTMWMIRKPIMAQLYVAPNGLQVAVLAGTSHTQNDDTYIIIAAQIHTTHNTYPRHPYILCIFERLRCCSFLGALAHLYVPDVRGSGCKEPEFHQPAPLSISEILRQ